MLKLRERPTDKPLTRSAAFGRLCVETKQACLSCLAQWSAAFGRLCVETTVLDQIQQPKHSAAFGRLCVETKKQICDGMKINSAAFGRLCVETIPMPALMYWSKCQPPSGGCVLKRGVGDVQVIVRLSAAFGRLCVETN